jgi:antitoxin (DNA-binding transcriptional repressor) of toxin-antitoxin stability system
VKTVTKQQAITGLEDLGNSVLAGETVIITDAGKPWIQLVPAPKGRPAKSAAAFKARLDRISSKPIRGAAGVLKRLRE